MQRLMMVATLGLAMFLAWIIYLADTGQPSVFFKLVEVTPHGDKVGHLMLFGLLTLGANVATRFRSLSLGFANVWLGTLSVALLASLEELSQLFIPTRTADPFDLLADALGISLFALMSARLNTASLRVDSSAP